MYEYKIILLLSREHILIQFRRLSFPFLCAVRIECLVVFVHQLFPSHTTAPLSRLSASQV
jgi:hypothetical protein